MDKKNTLHTFTLQAPKPCRLWMFSLSMIVVGCLSLHGPMSSASLPSLPHNNLPTMLSGTNQGDSQTLGGGGLDEPRPGPRPTKPTRVEAAS